MSAPIPEAGPAPALAVEPPKPLCAACGHLDADHDAIGVRFCAVTSSRGLTRGCVCSKN